MPDRYGDDPPTDLDAPPRALAIVDCGLCNDDGYTGSGRVCDHVDHRPAARRGMALVQAELAKIRQRKANRARGADQ